MTPRLPDPNSCFWCDQPKQGHFQRWAMGVGFHKWVEPGDGMRLHRMKARRAARLAAKQPPTLPDSATIATITANAARVTRAKPQPICERDGYSPEQINTIRQGILNLAQPPEGPNT